MPGIISKFFSPPSVAVLCFAILADYLFMDRLSIYSGFFCSAQDAIWKKNLNCPLRQKMQICFDSLFSLKDQ